MRGSMAEGTEQRLRRRAEFNCAMKSPATFKCVSVGTRKGTKIRIGGS